MRLPNKKVIQVFEYEKLYTKKRNGLLTQDQWEALIKFNDGNNQKYFSVIHQGVKFRQYVGVIQVGDLTIEILPKADNNRNSDSEKNKKKWHQVLFDMLRECKLLKLESSTYANLKLRHHSLMDLYIYLFLEQVEQIIHKGLIKKYRKKSANSLALKGRIEFQEQISKNLIHKERFFVHHQVYDQVHLLHQILLEALLIIPVVSQNPDFSDQVGRIFLNFPEMPKTKITEHTFNQIKLSRKTNHYRKAVDLAKLLLLNYNPDIKRGRENVLAILFDMNRLFEEYVFRMLKKEKGIQVSAQKRIRFWEYKLIKPDIIVQYEEETIVLDTKWKILKEVKPSDADLKQMYAYHHYFGATKTILLYPKVYHLAPKTGTYSIPAERPFRCKIDFVSVLDKEGELNQKIGEEILESIRGG